MDLLVNAKTSKFFIQECGETMTEAVKCHGEFHEFYDTFDEALALAESEGMMNYTIYQIGARYERVQDEVES